MPAVWSIRYIFAGCVLNFPVHGWLRKSAAGTWRGFKIYIILRIYIEPGITEKDKKSSLLYVLFSRELSFLCHHDFRNSVQDFVVAAAASGRAMGDFLDFVKSLQHILKLVDLVKCLFNIMIRNLLTFADDFIGNHKITSKNKFGTDQYLYHTHIVPRRMGRVKFQKFIKPKAESYRKDRLSGKIFR